MKHLLLAALLSSTTLPAGDLQIAELWEETVRQRYSSEEDDYRQFDENSPERVKEFYRQNHAYQSHDFVLTKQEEYLPLRGSKMSVWEVMELLDQLVDESDPDLDLPQSVHAFQTAEALRRDGHPRWLILTGFLHDLGKVLTFYGEPQWAVVGDTFPVGCAYAPEVVFPKYFEANPDYSNPIFQTKCGIYEEGGGLENVHMSWGHDEYLYHVLRDYLPEEAAFIIRYHSFYALHREGAYGHLLSERDLILLPWLKLFSQYDLYSKCPEPVDLDALLPYYRELVAEFLPVTIQW